VAHVIEQYIVKNPTRDKKMEALYGTTLMMIAKQDKESHLE